MAINNSVLLISVFLIETILKPIKWEIVHSPLRSKAVTLYRHSKTAEQPDH